MGGEHVYPRGGASTHNHTLVNAPVLGLSRREQLARLVRGAVLEAALREHRHVQSGHRLDPRRDDLPLERIQPVVVPVGQLDERNPLGDRDDTAGRRTG